MDTFNAGVQYNDFVGTAAADGSDNAPLMDYLQAQGVAEENERVLGIRVASGENGGLVPVETVAIVAYLCAAADLSPQPAKLRAVEVTVSPGQAFAFFKRFDLVISRKGVDLTAAEVDGPHWG